MYLNTNFNKMNETLEKLAQVRILKNYESYEKSTP